MVPVVLEVVVDIESPPASLASLLALLKAFLLSAILSLFLGLGAIGEAVTFDVATVPALTMWGFPTLVIQRLLKH
jgi:hypothetical protein